MKYIVLTLLLIGCATQPRAIPIFIDREVEVTDVWLEFNSNGIRAGSFPQGYGAVVYGIGVNPKDTNWYGHPQVNVYTTDEPAGQDSTWDDGDLIYTKRGWWTTGFYGLYMSVDTLYTIPANSWRYYVAFTLVDREKLSNYFYATVSFHAEGGPVPGY